MTRSLQITLTTAGTVYDLVTLIRANTQIAAEEVLFAFFPQQVAQIIIQASGGLITLVDHNSNSNTGPTIANGDNIAFGSGNLNNLDLSSIKLKADTDATKANLTIISV